MLPQDFLLQPESCAMSITTNPLPIAQYQSLLKQQVCTSFG